MMSRFRRALLKDDLTYLTQNLGLLLGSGVDVASALDSILQGVNSRSMKNIVLTMREEVKGGTPLWEVLENSRLFPERVTAMVRVGEESGQLIKHFKMIGDQEEKQREFSSKLMTALLYPGFVFVVTLIVGISVSWLILPKLAHVFFQLKLELPLITTVILGFGTFLAKFGFIAVPLFVLTLTLVGYVVFVLPSTKWLGEYFLVALPGVGQLLQEIEIARLGFLLGGLLKSGVPIVEALDSLQSATGSARYRALYLELRLDIDRGDSLESSLRSIRNVHSLIPVPVQQLLITGSHTGRLADVLLQVGSTYEEKSDASTRNLSVILEPILLFVVWAAVLSVALGVILPIYKLIGSVNTHH